MDIIVACSDTKAPILTERKFPGPTLTRVPNVQSGTETEFFLIFHHSSFYGATTLRHCLQQDLDIF